MAKSTAAKSVASRSAGGSTARRRVTKSKPVKASRPEAKKKGVASGLTTANVERARRGESKLDTICKVAHDCPDCELPVKVGMLVYRRTAAHQKCGCKRRNLDYNMGAQTEVVVLCLLLSLCVSFVWVLCCFVCVVCCVLRLLCDYTYV